MAIGFPNIPQFEVLAAAFQFEAYVRLRDVPIIIGEIEAEEHVRGTEYDCRYAAQHD